MYVHVLKKHKITNVYWKRSLVQKNQLNSASYTQNSVTDPQLSVLNQARVLLFVQKHMMVGTFMFNILKQRGRTGIV